MSDPTDQAAFSVYSKSLVLPYSDYRRWLNDCEKKISGMATENGWPADPSWILIYDAENRDDWYRAGVVELQRLTTDVKYVQEHRFANPNAASTTGYLKSEHGDGIDWGYQSKRWYVGMLMELAACCREVMEKQDWFKLAGYSFLLGKFDREFDLKFSGAKRLEEYEAQHTAALDRGNNTIRARADAWKAEVRRIIASHPNINLDNASAAALDILDAWRTDGLKRPGHRTLRDYLSKLAKRVVLPK